MDKEHMDKLRTVADRYGFDKQIIVLFEEMSELQKAVCKYSRTRCGSGGNPSVQKHDIAEEMADVEIMVYQIMYLIGISPERVDEIIGQKLHRQLMRMKGEVQE